MNIKKAVLAVLVGAMALSACASEKGEAVPVQAVTDIANFATGLQDRYLGKVVSMQTQNVERDENRVIKEVLVAAGDKVTAGQLLLTYDMDELDLSIEQGELELERLKGSIKTSENQISVLKKERDNADSSEKLSYTLEIQALEVEIKQTEYNIGAKEVELDRLRAAKDNTEVFSEIDGIVQSINENGFDNYGNPLPYIVIMQVGQYRVEGKINEYNANSLPFGAQVIIRSRINEETTWAGTVDYVDYENPVSGQNGYYGFGETATKYPFYVTVETSEGLMLGQHVYIELDNGQEEEKDGLWIPETYIVYEGDKTFVWAADDDEIEKREITVAETNYDLGQVLVSEGLTEEDWIAFPAEGIIEGSPVIKQEQQDQTEPQIGPVMPTVGAADLIGG